MFHINKMNWCDIMIFNQLFKQSFLFRVQLVQTTKLPTIIQMKFKLFLNVLFVSAVAFGIDNFLDMFIAKRVWIAGSHLELWSLTFQKYSATLIMEYALRSKWTIPKPQ